MLLPTLRGWIIFVIYVDLIIIINQEMPLSRQKGSLYNASEVEATVTTNDHVIIIIIIIKSK